MTRLSAAGLLALDEGLSESERQLVEVVSKLRLCSHSQLASLLVSPTGELPAASQARMARRTLAGLTDARVLARLKRRIGGVRAGSAGYCYYLGPAGQRLIAYWQGRGLVRGRFRPEPGGRYVRHRLAVSDIYVQTLQAQRQDHLELIGFDVEPDCWRRYSDGLGGQRLLKPDGLVRVGVGDFEDRFFLEVDLGSESRPVIGRKLRAYVDYFQTGSEQAEHGVFPRVLLLTTTASRKAALIEVCTGLPTEYWKLFGVGTLDQALDLFSGEHQSSS